MPKIHFFKKLKIATIYMIFIGLILSAETSFSCIIEGDNVSETVKFQPIYFSYDQTLIQQSEIAKLKCIANILLNREDISLKVEGHTDERGAEEYNLDLGERMARSVKDFLIMHGVEEHRLAIYSYGETQPVAVGNHKSAWNANRRVELHLK